MLRQVHVGYLKLRIEWRRRLRSVGIEMDGRTADEVEASVSGTLCTSKRVCTISECSEPLSLRFPNEVQHQVPDISTVVLPFAEVQGQSP